MSDVIVTTKDAVMAAIRDAVTTSPRLKKLADDSVQLDVAMARIRQLESDLEGVRLINKLQDEQISEQRHTLRQWLAANAPGGWIDELRKAANQ